MRDMNSVEKSYVKDKAKQERAYREMEKSTRKPTYFNFFPKVPYHLEYIRKQKEKEQNEQSK